MAGMYDKNKSKEWSKRNLSAFEGLLNVNQFLPVTGDIQSGIMAAQDVKKGNYGSAALNSLGLLPFIPAMGGVLKDINPLRSWMPNPRGGWTNDKIEKALKSGTTGARLLDLPQKRIAEFESPEDFANNLYWHGTGSYLSQGLKPSIAIPKRELERIGGGGYGQQYYGASVSKDKNIASNFTGQSRTGRVYPVILDKNANVRELKELQDAADLEDIISNLWNENVDAVKIGDWSSPYSEKELAILNPRAAYTINDPTNFQVFQKQRFENPSQQQIENIYNLSKEQMKELNAIGSLPTKEERDLATQKLYFRGLLSD